MFDVLEDLFEYVIVLIGTLLWFCVLLYFFEIIWRFLQYVYTTFVEYMYILYIIVIFDIIILLLRGYYDISRGGAVVFD